MISPALEPGVAIGYLGGLETGGAGIEVLEEVGVRKRRNICIILYQRRSWDAVSIYTCACPNRFCVRSHDSLVLGCRTHVNLQHLIEVIGGLDIPKSSYVLHS